jgi:signal peptidase I
MLCTGIALALGGCRGNVRAIEKSMEPTIHSGDLVTVDYHAYEHHPPEPGDIVAVTAPAGAAQERCGARVRPRSPCPRPTARLDEDLQLIKRVIAGPGQRVAIARDGGAIVDGERVPEPYIQACAPVDRCGLPHAIRVPPGHWFLLGDNRPYSSDSRFWGPVPTRAITGSVDPARHNAS